MPTNKIPSRARTTAVLSAVALLPAALTACGGSSKAAAGPHASVAPSGGTAPATGTTGSTTAAPAPHTATPSGSKGSSSTAAPGARPLARAPRVSPAKARQAFVHVLTVFTDCLRKNGINMPKPKTSGHGLPLPSTKGINTRSAQYRAATAKCRPVVTEALRSSGIASGGR